MQIKLFQVDAFTKKLFKGNPAAVCPLEQWLPDEVMQAIANENNLSETAFLVRQQQDYHIRWFTPAAEVALCGHATLAAAFVLFEFYIPNAEQIIFHSASGALIVKRYPPYGLQLQMPMISLQDWAPSTNILCEGLGGIIPSEIYQTSQHCVAVLQNETDVLAAKPNMSKLAQVGKRAIIITAPAQQVDFVSRYFVPELNREDPVTGVAHCVLVPFWAQRLAKNKLHAEQLSQRGGHIYGEWKADKVYLSGQAALYLIGTITLT